MTKFQKRLLMVVASSFLLILVVQFYLDNEEWIDPSPPVERKVEILGSHLMGYEAGNKSWEVKTQYSWAGENKYLFFVDTLKEGVVYDKEGAMVLEDITADKARVNSKSRMIHATDNVTAAYNRKDTQGEQSTIFIEAGELKYFSYNKKTYLKDDVVLTQENSEILAQRVEMDTDQNIVSIDSDFKYSSDEYTATAQRMEMFLDQDYSELHENVLVVRLPEEGPFDDVDERDAEIRSKESHIRANYLKKSKDSVTGNETVMEGEVDISQEGKRIRGDSARYVQEKGTFEVKGNVLIDLASLNWMVGGKRKEQVKNEDVKEMLAKELHIKCDDVFVDMENKRVMLKGDVILTQKDAKARCRSLEIDDEKGLITMIGNVFLKREGKGYLMSDKVIFDMDKEEFWTEAPAELQFEVDEK